MLRDLENFDYVHVIDACHRPRLGLEPVENMSPCSGPTPYHLQGFEPVEPDITRLKTMPIPPSPSTSWIS